MMRVAVGVGLSLSLGLGASLMVSGSAWGQTNNVWQPFGGGEWSVSSNWNLGRAPISTDWALVTETNGGTSVVDVASTVSGLLVGVNGRVANGRPGISGVLPPVPLLVGGVGVTVGPEGASADPGVLRIYGLSNGQPALRLGQPTGMRVTGRGELLLDRGSIGVGFGNAPVVRLDQGNLLIEEGGLVRGEGVIDFGIRSTGTARLINDGTLEVGPQTTTGFIPSPTELRFRSDAPIEMFLGGFNFRSRVVLTNNASMVFEAGVDPFSFFGADLEMARASVLDVADDWQFQGDLTVDTPGRFGQAELPATIRGGTVEWGGQTDVLGAQDWLAYEADVVSGRGLWFLGADARLDFAGGYELRNESPILSFEPQAIVEAEAGSEVNFLGDGIAAGLAIRQTGQAINHGAMTVRPAFATARGLGVEGDFENRGTLTLAGTASSQATDAELGSLTMIDGATLAFTTDDNDPGAEWGQITLGAGGGMLDGNLVLGNSAANAAVDPASFAFGDPDGLSIGDVITLITSSGFLTGTFDAVDTSGLFAWDASSNAGIAADVELIVEPSRVLARIIEAVAGLAGDFNGSGSVEQGDLDLVLTGWGGTRTGFQNDDGFATGLVDQEELDAVLTNWGSSSAPSFAANPNAIPEPGALGLAGLAGLGLVGARRRGSGAA